MQADLSNHLLEFLDLTYRSLATSRLILEARFLPMGLATTLEGGVAPGRGLMWGKALVAGAGAVMAVQAGTPPGLEASPMAPFSNPPIWEAAGGTPRSEEQ